MAVNMPVQTLVEFANALSDYNVTIDGAQRPGSIMAHAWLRNGTADERYVNTVIKFDYINNVTSIYVTVNKNSKFDYLRDKLNDSNLFTKLEDDTYALSENSETIHSTGRLDAMYTEVAALLGKTFEALATILY